MDNYLNETLKVLRWAQSQLNSLVGEDLGNGCFIRGTYNELVGFGPKMQELENTIGKLLRLQLNQPETMIKTNFYECETCSHALLKTDNFCPKCGAKAVELTHKGKITILFEYEPSGKETLHDILSIELHKLQYALQGECEVKEMSLYFDYHPPVKEVI